MAWSQNYAKWNYARKVRVAQERLRDAEREFARLTT